MARCRVDVRNVGFDPRHISCSTPIHAHRFIALSGAGASKAQGSDLQICRHRSVLYPHRARLDSVPSSRPHNRTRNVSRRIYASRTFRMDSQHRMACRDRRTLRSPCRRVVGECQARFCKSSLEQGTRSRPWERLRRSIDRRNRVYE